MWLSSPFYTLRNKKNLKIGGCAVFCFIFLSSCTKEKTKEIIRTERVTTEVLKEKLVETFDLLPDSITTAPEKIQKLASATGLVLGLTSDTGSGFFISDDGLFITNEHVLTESSCHEGGCPGFIIVRDYHENGQKEVFSKYKVLAQSKEYDFTLLKVDLPEGRKLPFIPLSKGEPSPLSDSFYILGHPRGTYLRWTKALELEVKNDLDLHALGLAFPGHSGGVIVDLKNLHGVGLLKEISDIVYIKKSLHGKMQRSVISTRLDSLLWSLIDAYTLPILALSELKAQYFLPEKILFNSQVNAPRSKFIFNSSAIIDYLSHDYFSENFTDNALIIANHIDSHGSSIINSLMTTHLTANPDVRSLIYLQKLLYAKGTSLQLDSSMDIFLKELLSNQYPENDQIDLLVKIVFGEKPLEPHEQDLCLQSFYQVDDFENLSDTMKFEEVYAIVTNLTLICGKLPLNNISLMNHFLESFDWRISQSLERSQKISLFGVHLQLMTRVGPSEQEQIINLLKAMEEKEVVAENRLEIISIGESFLNGFWRNQLFSTRTDQKQRGIQ